MCLIVRADVFGASYNQVDELKQCVEADYFNIIIIIIDVKR